MSTINKFKRQITKGRKMKITTLDTVLVDIDEKPYTDPQTQTPFTLRRAMKAALGNHVQSDASADAKHKELCYDLMIAVSKANGELEMDAENVTIIKKRIAEMYPPWIVGQAAKLIESKE